MRLRNYRLFATGSLVSNIGTWMQRVAQDWLVLTLTGSAGALGITTGLQFLPILLFSPIAGVLADRFPKRRLLAVTQVAMGVTAGVLGLSGRHRLGDGLAHLRDRLPVRAEHRHRCAGQAGLRARAGAARPTPERGRAELGVVQSRACHRPGHRGRPDRLARIGCRSDRLGDPAQRRQLHRGDRVAGPDASRRAVADTAAATSQWPAPSRHPLRARQARHHARDGGPVLRRHVRSQLPDDDGLDGDRDLRQGRRRVRHARLGAGRSAHSPDRWWPPDG